MNRVKPGHDNPRPIRRCFSRIIDLLIAWILVIGLSVVFVPRLADESATLLWIVTAAAWIPIEALLLSMWGTTPGKWLLKSRVEGAATMTYSAALDRSFTVFCWGLGCLIPFVSVLCWAVGYQDLTDTGTTRWDQGKSRLLHAELGWGRIYSTAAVILVLLVAYSYLHQGR